MSDPRAIARKIVMDAPKYDNAVGDLLSHGMREDLIDRFAEALAAVERQRDETREQCESLLYVIRDALDDLPYKPYDAEATLRTALPL